MSPNVLLLGSIPLDTPGQVFRQFGVPLGCALKTMPDGEVGRRKHWISRIHCQVLAGHRDLETIRYPASENGVERLNPRNSADSYLFRVKDGIDRVRFGDRAWRIGYARAIYSYFVFATDAFLAPLKDLNARSARVYLGIVHNMDGFKERLALARKYLRDFGLAAYCGFGRMPPSAMPARLNEHLQAIEAAG
jgi:hypothetical protein